MSVSAGSRLGPYEILSVLGTGGMGEVYKARDTRLHRDVAVKVMPASLAGEPDRLVRFEQEARAAAALNHPNILVVYDVGTHDGQPYLVSELLGGTTLREALAEGALPPSKATDIARQVATGLAAAHANGITHRDIKPENLFLVQDGRVKILDFGLARLGAGTGTAKAAPYTANAAPYAAEAAPYTSAAITTPRLTDVGVVLGTVGYMSPEQVRGLAADTRSDIFSVGVVLFEMLAGTRPFKGDSAVETMNAILKVDAPDLSADTYNLPPTLDRIVRHCLEKNPDERFQSARDLAFALQSSLTGSSAASASMGALAGSTYAATPRRRRERVAWGLATAFCLSTFGLVAMAYLRHAPATSVVRVAIPVPETATISRGFGLESSAGPGSGPNPLALSPDGRYLTFVALVGSTRFLWLRPLDSLTANRLGGTEGASGPFWSPDSRSIAFFANGKLRRVDVAGGEPQTLSETFGVGGATWNQEGMILLSQRGESGLVRVPASGGAISPVTRLDPVHGETNHIWPTFLPDGRHFLYNVMARDGAGIYVGSLDSADRNLLIPFNLKDPDDVGLSTLAYAAPGYVLYVRGQTLMAQSIDLGQFRLSGPAVPVAEGVEKVGPGSAAFSVSNTGVLAYWGGSGTQTTQLTWRARDGTVVGRLGAPGGYTEVELAPDERRIAVSRVDPGKQAAIWVLDVTRDTAMKVSFDPVSLRPVWSPDSASLAFGSARDGPPSIFQKTVTGSGQEVLLLKSNRANFPTDWCAAPPPARSGPGFGGQAGGQMIVFGTTDAQTQSDIWMLPLTGDRKPIGLLRTPSNEVDGRCSPDGRWLAYSSDESGRPEIYVTGFPKPGGKWPISTSGGSQPRWRRDGTELFYLAPDRTVMAAVVRAGSTFEAGAVTPLFKIRGGSYAPTADGRRFVTDDPIGEAIGRPITIVLNWTAGLRK